MSPQKYTDEQLVTLNGKSAKEAARLLGVSEASIKARRREARARGLTVYGMPVGRPRLNKENQ